MTAGVAGNMAMNGLTQLGRGERPSARDLLLTPRNVGRITDQLAKMRGAAMKIGQLISMDGGDVLPRIGRDHGPAPVGRPYHAAGAAEEDAERKLARWLAARVRTVRRPTGCGGVYRPGASCAAARRARSGDQGPVPRVAQSIDSDVANVGALVRMSGLLPAGFDLAPYLAEARRQLHEETDYQRESRQLLHFGALLKDDDRFDLPDPVAEWTTPVILAMTFRDGIPIEHLRSAAEDDRNAAARHLVELLLRELFVFGMMQTDPNFANYLYNPITNRIVLLDFGATRRIESRFADLYRRLILAGLAGDVAALRAAAGEPGLLPVPRQPQHRDRIIRMIAMVFEEITKDRCSTSREPTSARRMQDEGTALAADGFVPPPLPIDVLSATQDRRDVPACVTAGCAPSVAGYPAPDPPHRSDRAALRE